MRLLIGENPRSLVVLGSLVSGAATGAGDGDVALVFQVVAGSQDQCSARFQLVETLDINEYDESRRIWGCLGVVQIDTDIFVGVVTEATKVQEIAGSPIFRIDRVAFYSLLSNAYDDIDLLVAGDVPKFGSAGSLVGSFVDYEAQQQQQQTQYLQDQRLQTCANIAKILSMGSFFFSPHRDLTRSMQTESDQSTFVSPFFNSSSRSSSRERFHERSNNISIFDVCDKMFLWNNHMLSTLLQIRERDLNDYEKASVDRAGLLIAAIQGFVGSTDVWLGNGMRGRIAIVSRLSCKKAGTRYNARGIDDDGNVSNFVETEFIFSTPSLTMSYLQVRGSVPVFWEQSGFQVTHKIDIARGPESTAPAFQKHFELLRTRYSNVQIINLLGQREGSAESTLTEAFKSQLRRLDRPVGYTGFDFHSIVKSGSYEKVSMLVEQVRHVLESWGYFLVDNGNGGGEVTTVVRQSGVLRVNCLDCLDRTNVVQACIAKHILEKILNEIGCANVLQDETFMNSFNGLWADNGDMLSKIYAGTGALKSSLTRKGKHTMLGFLDDAQKSLNRFYINNFQDKGRQEAIDIILGNTVKGTSLLMCNPVHDAVASELEERKMEYSTISKIQILMGTWNVNGKLPYGEQVEPWLTSQLASCPHIIALGIQELIELTAQQYVTADTEKLRAIWETHLLRIINLRQSVGTGSSTTATAAAAGGGQTYVLLRSTHLVALAIFIFVRQDCVSLIRKVETAITKTGFNGIAGNKGGVAVSLLFHDTRFAFVTAHLAAGGKAVDERNRDYWTITDGLSFRGRKLADHDTIIWFGDFNYRVELSTYEARDLIQRRDLKRLIAQDQLNQQRSKRAVFEGFEEGPLTFDPTYKYDNGTNVYDTSEKARVPSWTDRVLYMGYGVQLLEYARAECLMSDHRPVRAVFEATCMIIDSQQMEAIRNQIYSRNSGGRGEMIKEPLKFRQKSKFVRPPSGGLIVDLSTESGWIETGKQKQKQNQPRHEPPFLSNTSSDSDAFPSAPAFDEGKLIDLDDSSSSSTNPLLPPPSSAESQWWNRTVDESWIPKEGDSKNPFYSFQ